MAESKYKSVRDIKQSANKPSKPTRKKKVASRSKSKVKGQRARQRARFSDQGLYYFDYKDPKYFSKLHKFDRKPLIYPLDIGPDTTLAINLHWLNPIWRLKFVNMLQEASEKIRDRRKFVKWVYVMFRDDPKLRFAYPAIRRYINKRMKNSIRIDRNEVGEDKFTTLLNTKYPSRIIKGGLE